uniref:Lipocalin/cytosolic fatty-acid binding domain-containing protein n=1 Tax=Amblyomma maculatum TaxID=34609 RepID=G3MSK2_AMBMU
MKSFAIALFLVLSAMAFGAKRLTTKDLYEALDTEERIWITLRSYTRTTEGKNNTCIYAWKFFLKGTRYQFGQYYKAGNKSYKGTFYANITEGPRPALQPVLMVSKMRTGHAGIPYTLQYWDRVHHCGILTFMERGRKQCEMHVWEKDNDITWPKYLRDEI